MAETARNKAVAKKKNSIPTDKKGGPALGGSPFKPSSMAGAGAQYNSSFLGITRDQYFETRVKNPVIGPPPGAYRAKFDAIDS